MISLFMTLAATQISLLFEPTGSLISSDNKTSTHSLLSAARGFYWLIANIRGPAYLCVNK